jgi:hypothetical protein
VLDPEDGLEDDEEDDSSAEEDVSELCEVVGADEASVVLVVVVSLCVDVDVGSTSLQIVVSEGRAEEETSEEVSVKLTGDAFIQNGRRFERVDVVEDIFERDVDVVVGSRDVVVAEEVFAEEEIVEVAFSKVALSSKIDSTAVACKRGIVSRTSRWKVGSR